MEAISALRQDHGLLRKKLALLESALQVAPEARYVLREMSFSLLRLLQDHMRREACVVQVFRQQCGEVLNASSAREHTTEHTLLRAVYELLLSGMRASVPMIVLRLSQAIEQLEEHMEEQERTVFAALEFVEESREAQEPATISGAMSVNEILQRYPQTERVFEQLHVNRLQEGYDSVDELAWRHGMEVSQVIEQLRQVATFPID